MSITRMCVLVELVDTDSYTEFTEMLRETVHWASTGTKKGQGYEMKKTSLPFESSAALKILK